MASNYTGIEKALLESFLQLNFSGQFGYGKSYGRSYGARGNFIPIGYIGAMLKPEDKGSDIWIQLRNLRADSRPVTLGNRGEDNHVGIFQIDINAPKQIGSGKQLSIADKIASHYEAGGGHIEDNQPVHWLGSFASPMLILEGYQKIALSVRYYARTTRGQ